MNSQNQILNYLQWTRDRGLQWPAVSEMRPAPAAAMECCENIASHDVLPHRISLLTQLPSALDSEMNDESLQLLERMCSATKISSAEFSMVGLSCCPKMAASAVATRWQKLMDLKPEFVLILGEDFGTFLNQTLGMNLELGIVKEHSGTPLLLTYHPHILLSDPPKKIPAWRHLQIMMRMLQK